MPRPAQSQPPPIPSWTTRAVAPPILQVTAPDNDASAAAEPLLNKHLVELQSL